MTLRKKSLIQPDRMPVENAPQQNIAPGVVAQKTPTRIQDPNAMAKMAPADKAFTQTQPFELAPIQQQAPQITPVQGQSVVPNQDIFPQQPNVNEKVYNGQPIVDLTPQGVSTIPTPQVPEGKVDPKLLEKTTPTYWQKYGNYNWDQNGGDFLTNARQANMSLADAIRYYDAYQKDNGGKELDPFLMYATMGKYDPTKSIKDQEAEDAEMKQRQQWENVGNVLSHMANLYYTSKGAPAAPYESGQDLTKRQQEQRDRVTALREAAGKRYLDALQLKKANEFKQQEQDYKNLAAERKAVIDGQKMEIMKQKLEAANKAAEAKAAGDEKKAAYYEAQAKALEARAANLEASTKYIGVKTQYYPTEVQTRRIAAQNGTARIANENMDEETTTSENILGTEKTQVKRKIPRGKTQQPVRKSRLNWGGKK